MRPPSAQDRERIERLAAGASDVSALLDGTADLLHDLSQHAGVVTTPRPKAEANIRLDVAGEKERILEHDAELLAKFLQIQQANVHAIEQNLAALNVVEAQQ